MTITLDGEAQLLEAGRRRLGELLGSSFEVGDYNIAGRPPARAGGPVDAMVTIKDNSTGISAVVLVEAKAHLSPVGVRRELAPRWDLLGRMPGQVTPLVVAPWLSPRTRTELDHAGYSYLDLTGNVSIDVPNPRLRFLLQGAQRDPAPRGGGTRTLAGPKAGRLVRLLIDVAPPHRPTDLATHARLGLPYVSRLLQVMEDRGLIERSGRVVDGVDWVGLIRERAEQSNLLRANPWVAMVAPQGRERVLDRLRNTPTLVESVAVTGSAAARVIAPTAVGGQLMIYVPGEIHAPDEIGRSLGLLRSERGGDVLLLRAANPVVFEHTRDVDGVRHVALSQLVLDCLTGNGRMPAEGEAVLSYMVDHVDEWRLARLEGL